MSARVLAALVLTSVVVSGCARGCTSSRPPIHLNPSMDAQPKVRAQTANNFFYNGASMREPVPGTVPIGGLKEDTAFFTGKGADEQFVMTNPVTVDEATMLLEEQDENFLVFHNADHQKVSVIYKRKDGNYGLIEP